MANRTTRAWHPPLAWTVCTDPFAGTVTGYRRHCDRRAKVGNDGRRVGNRHKFCDACRYAIAEQSYKYRNRRILNGAKEVRRDAKNKKLVGGELLVDATGTRRRLQGLNAFGWSYNEIGSRLGQKGTNIGFTALKRKFVYPETAQKVKALYEELSMIPPPDTGPVSTVRSRAYRKGWLPPFAWDDDTIDNPYTLPEGMTSKILWAWFTNCATELEKIEWVLENGMPKPYR